MKYTGDTKICREHELAKSILHNLVLSIFITLALSVVLVSVLRLRLDIVLSNSMNPTFCKDDIVVVRACDDYNVGDIVEYQLGDNMPVTHRIERKIGYGKNAIFETKGDANPSSDEMIPYSAINGKVIAVIEDGNYIYEFIKNNYLLLLNILLGIGVLTSTLSVEMEIRRHNIANV